MIALILLVFSLVCFLLSAAGVGREYPKLNLMALGLAFLAGWFLLGARTV